MMQRGRDIFIYLESPPLDSNIAVHGLYRAGTPILKSIRDRIESIALYPMDRRYRAPQVDPSLRPLCRSLPLAFTLLRALRKRLLPDDFENGAVAAIVGGWARRSPATQVFALEGSDPEVLARVDALAARAGKPFAVYMVDDFAWPMRLAGRPETDIAATQARMQRSLARARHVFAITDELAELVHRQFGVTPVTLPLAFEPGPRPNLPVKDQIFFLGSVNFLYADAIRLLVQVVGRLRAETGRDLTIRFTSPAAHAELGPLPAFVQVAPIAGAGALAEEIAASLAAFLPYSFDEKLRTMVTTSFPSKSMEYLAYARSILVHAPDYSNSARMFSRAHLPTVTSSMPELETALRSHLAEAPDHSALYRTYLEKRHAPAAVRAIILETLEG
jgi:hypothetical protein